MSGTFGPTSRTPLAFYDPETCSWKMSGVMFPSDWPTSSQTCPPWGMTRRGELFELPMPALPTPAPASSSSPLTEGHLLPTPNPFHMGNTETPDEWMTRRAEVQERTGTRHGPALSVVVASVLEGAPLVQTGDGPVRLLPTPVADHSRGLPQPGTDYSSLPNAVIALMPTPRATDGTKGGPNQRGSSGDLMLPSAVCQLLPTPTAMDSKASGGSSPSDVTLTDAVVRTSFGALTNPRFAAGSAPSADAHPDQLSLDATENDSPPSSLSG